MGNGTNLKSRYMAAVFSFVLLTLLTLALAANADAILSGARGAATLNPVSQLARAFSSKRCLYMWLLLDGLGLLGIYWALFGKSYLDYRSKMFEVVPGFEIPMPEGQGQHGTAWWLPKDQYGVAFSAVTTDDFAISESLMSKYADERGKVDAVDISNE